MKGRRTAAMLCVLLGHALVVLSLLTVTRAPAHRAAQSDIPSWAAEPIYIGPLLDDQLLPPEVAPRATAASPANLDAPSLAAESLAGAEGSAADPARGYVDWPKEGREAAARVLAREAEAERIAKLFAGPQGTWASLTKRQQSELNHFRWKPGVDGLERDAKGNTIYRVSDGCSLVNFMMIACALGKKPPAYGDMFKDMRLYFDEQRLPATKDGNGREPESMRPPKWSKPLP